MFFGVIYTKSQSIIIYIKNKHQERKLVNSNLAKIGMRIKCLKKLSAYCLRYSCANICKPVYLNQNLGK